MHEFRASIPKGKLATSIQMVQIKWDSMSLYNICFWNPVYNEFFLFNTLEGLNRKWFYVLLY